MREREHYISFKNMQGLIKKSLIHSNNEFFCNFMHKKIFFIKTVQLLKP